MMSTGLPFPTFPAIILSTLFPSLPRKKFRTDAGNDAAACPAMADPEIWPPAAAAVRADAYPSRIICFCFHLEMGFDAAPGLRDILFSFMEWKASRALLPDSLS